MTEDSVMLGNAVRIRGGGFALGPQGQSLRPAVTTRTAGSLHLSTGDVVMKPGHYTGIHAHDYSETVVTVLDGYAATVVFDNDGTETYRVTKHNPGDHVYIPPGAAHAAINLSRNRAIVAVECRTDPHFNTDVELLPHLDHLMPALAERLQTEHSDAIARAKANGTHSW